MARRLEDLSDDELQFLAFVWFVYRPCLIALVKALSEGKIKGVALLDNGDTFDSNGSI